MAAKVGYNSTEAIKRSEDAVTGVGGSMNEQRNSSLTKPFYNNLVTQSQKRSSFGNNGLNTGTKRNFKSVKSNKDTMTGKQLNDLSLGSNKKST